MIPSFVTYPTEFVKTRSQFSGAVRRLIQSPDDMANVLLLRSPTRDAPDKYEDTFRSYGYHPLSVPVLETVLENLDDLKAALTGGKITHAYGAVIITSGRACEAWRTAAVALEEQGGYPGPSPHYLEVI